MAADIMAMWLLTLWHIGDDNVRKPAHSSEPRFQCPAPLVLMKTFNWTAGLARRVWEIGAHQKLYPRREIPAQAELSFRRFASPRPFASKHFRYSLSIAGLAGSGKLHIKREEVISRSSHHSHGAFPSF